MLVRLCQHGCLSSRVRSCCFGFLATFCSTSEVVCNINVSARDTHFSAFIALLTLAS